jgi:hypothetical protein
MYDEDDDHELPAELLLLIPQDKRRAFTQLRDMAALKQIYIYPSTTDDGLLGFRLEHQGASVRCPDLLALKAALIAHGVPLLADSDLQTLLQAFQQAFTLSMGSDESAQSPAGHH